MGAEHTQLLLHTYVRWLSRGRVFTRLFELRVELQISLEQTKSNLLESIKNFEFVSLLAYMADIFEKLRNILDLTDKGTCFHPKDMHLE